MFKFDCMDIIHTTAFRIQDTKGDCVFNYTLANVDANGKYVINQTLQDLIRFHLTKIVEKAFKDDFDILSYRLSDICCSTYTFVSGVGNKILFYVSSDEVIPMNSKHKWFDTCQEAITEGKL